MALRLAFMGTPDFAVPTLLALIAEGHSIAAVYSQPPARAGRGKALKKSPVHLVAEEHGIPVFTPKNMKQESEQDAFAALKLDAAVVVAYGQILPKAVLDAPKHGCVNVHASLLPRWRGAAPIHRAVMAGDSESGVCIMAMDEGLDTGAVISRHAVEINAGETTLSLHGTLATLGADTINAALTGLVDGSITPEPQSDVGVTYAKKIDKAEAKINWSLSATEIDRMVRGLFPFPGAWFEHSGERIKLLAGHVVEASGDAGTAISDTLLIGCGENAYQIERAQRAGKAAIDRSDLLRGWALPKGSTL